MEDGPTLHGNGADELESCSDWLVCLEDVEICRRLALTILPTSVSYFDVHLHRTALVSFNDSPDLVVLTEEAAL